MSVLQLPQNPAEREAVIAAGIAAWKLKTKQERLRDSFSRAELMALRDIERLLVRDNTIVDSLAVRCAMHPKDDVTNAVAVIMVLLSDNAQYGAAYMSIPRLGKLLSRHPNTIRRALDRLVDEGIFTKEERTGTSTLYVPVSSKTFAATGGFYKIINLHAPAPKKGGRPRKSPPVEVIDVAENPPPSMECGGISGGENPPPSGAESPLHACSVDESSNDSELSKRRGNARARQLSLADWGKRPNPIHAAADADCWFDDQGRVQVANEFRDELLALVGGNEAMMRELLDIAAKYVGVDVRPANRKNGIRGSFTKEIAMRREAANKGRDAGRSRSSSNAGAIFDAACEVIAELRQ